MAKKTGLNMDQLAQGAQEFNGGLSEEPKDGKITPTIASKETVDVNELRSLVNDLSSQVSKMTPARSATIRKRTKEHIVSMREFEADGKVVGLVNKLFDVKEVKDKTENKRFYGICKIEVLDPRTGEMKMYTDMDYLDFLNNARPVPLKIHRWGKTRRQEVEKKRGGGGIGILYRSTPQGEVPSGEFEYEVEYEDHEFTVEVMEGEFEGVKFDSTGTGFNI